MKQGSRLGGPQAQSGRRKARALACSLPPPCPQLDSSPPSAPLTSLRQVWRLVTNFTFLGKPSLAWLFQLVWL